MLSRYRWFHRQRTHPLFLSVEVKTFRSQASVTFWFTLSSLDSVRVKRQQVKGKVVNLSTKKVKLKRTWHCCRRSSQQDPAWVRRTTSSRAEHSQLRGEDSSPHNLRKPKPGTKYLSVSRLHFQPLPSSASSPRQYLSLCLPSTLPSISLSASRSLPRVVLWLQCIQRGQNPPVSSSHFLGKSELLPSIHPDTELFKDGWTLTHKPRRTHWWGTDTHPDVHLFPRIYCWQSSRTWWRMPSSSLWVSTKTCSIWAQQQ